MTPTTKDERHLPGWSHGHLAGRYLAHGHALQQERRPDVVFLQGEEAIREAAQQEWARKSTYHKSYRGPTFRDRYLRAFVVGYAVQIARQAKPPLVRICRVCGYEGEDVHAYRSDGAGRQPVYWECDSLARCQAIRLAQRRLRSRMPDDYTGALS